MLNPIEFSLDWTGAFDFLDCDMIENEIHKIVNNACASAVVLPKHISVIMDQTADIDAVYDLVAPRPRGMLRVRVRSASGLRCDDFNFSTMWNGKRSSDPFCEIRIGGE